MRQFIVFIIMSIIYIVVSSIEFAYSCDNKVAEEIGLQEYNKQCPWGDAVIVSKDEMEFLGKMVPMGTPYDCVNATNNGLWEVKNYDFVTHSWHINRINPRYYEVYVMDGHLIQNARGEVILEESNHKF